MTQTRTDLLLSVLRRPRTDEEREEELLRVAASSLRLEGMEVSAEQLARPEGERRGPRRHRR